LDKSYGQKFSVLFFGSQCMPKNKNFHAPAEHVLIIKEILLLSFG